MKKEIVVTGIGIYSPIGKNTKEVYESIINSRSGIKIIDEIEVSQLRNNKGGVIKDIKETETLNGFRSNMLLKHAAEEAICSSGINSIPLKERNRIGVSIGTSVGGYGAFIDHMYEEYSPEDTPTLSLNPHSTIKDNGDIIRNIPFSLLSLQIAQEYKFSGFISSSITACSASANAIIMGADMIKAGRIDIAVAGGVDPISQLTLLGFNSLMAMTKNDLKPMDEKRSGLLIGEGAACLIIEEKEHAIERGAPILATLSGCGVTNDAFHSTRPHPEATGAILAINHALEEASLSPSDIDYINLHGTGTKHNDLMELNALKAIWGDDIEVPISSSKSMMGHTLGAAGAIEAVISVISLHNHILPPNLNVTEKIKGFKYNIVHETQKGVKLNHVLSNSFGFGGNCASLVLSHYQ